MRSMQSGEYITNRFLVQMIIDACGHRGIELVRYSDDWILEMRKGETIGRVFGYKFPLNDSAAAYLAQDKVGAYEVLRKADVAAVEHRLLRTKVGEANVKLTSEEVVLKPLVGTSGHLVQAFESIDAAKEYINSSTVEAWAVSPRLDIVSETRLVILDNEVLLAYQKHPLQSEQLTMFNLGKGAVPGDIEPEQVYVELAQRASETLGLRLCAVDIVKTARNDVLVLEVNDGIMMEHYARHSAENYSKAAQVYDAIVGKMINS